MTGEWARAKISAMFGLFRSIALNKPDPKHKTLTLFDGDRLIGAYSHSALPTAIAAHSHGRELRICDCYYRQIGVGRAEGPPMLKVTTKRDV